MVSTSLCIFYIISSAVAKPPGEAPQKLFQDPQLFEYNPIQYFLDPLDPLQTVEEYYNDGGNKEISDYNDPLDENLGEIEFVINNVSADYLNSLFESFLASEGIDGSSMKVAKKNTSKSKKSSGKNKEKQDKNAAKKEDKDKAQVAWIIDADGLLESLANGFQPKTIFDKRFVSVRSRPSIWQRLFPMLSSYRSHVHRINKGTGM